MLKWRGDEKGRREEGVSAEEEEWRLARLARHEQLLPSFFFSLELATVSLHINTFTSHQQSPQQSIYSGLDLLKLQSIAYTL